MHSLWIVAAIHSLEEKNQTRVQMQFAASNWYMYIRNPNAFYCLHVK